MNALQKIASLTDHNQHAQNHPLHSLLPVILRPVSKVLPFQMHHEYSTAGKESAASPRAGNSRILF